MRTFSRLCQQESVFKEKNRVVELDSSRWLKQVKVKMQEREAICSCAGVRCLEICLRSLRVIYQMLGLQT
jgi:predicted metal-binding protein